MTTSDPRALVEEAINRGELRELLLGEPRYRYLPKFSPSPWRTDLTELLSAMCDGWNAQDSQRLVEEVARAIYSLVDQYEGLIPVAICILFEAIRNEAKSPSLGLPIMDIAERLMGSINTYSLRLRQDKSGPGAQWPDGLLGELRRLSRRFEEFGGLSFCK